MEEKKSDDCKTKKKRFRRLRICWSKTGFRNKIFILLICIFIISTGLFFLTFYGPLSSNVSDWGSFGGYLSGTVGTFCSFLAFYMMYKAWNEQREQVAIMKSSFDEVKKQQYLDIFRERRIQYFSVLAEIRKEWDLYKSIHGDVDIFIYAVRSASGNKDRFIENYERLGFIFRRYNYFIFRNLLDINKCPYMSSNDKDDYTNLFLLQLSVHEIVYLSLFLSYIESTKDYNFFTIDAFKLPIEYIFIYILSIDDNMEYTHIIEMCMKVFAVLVEKMDPAFVSRLENIKESFLSSINQTPFRS